MRILITGAAGMIGSHLVDYYMSRHNNVTGIDNISTGRIENIKHHFDKEYFKIIIDTVTNYSIMEELIKEADIVYHFAAPVGVKLIMKEPVKSVLNNTRGADVVLELCNKYRKPTFIASTSEVYGRTMDYENINKLQEDTYRIMGNTKTHRWAYANTKAFDEILAFAYHKEYGFPVVIGRFFNTIGQRQVGTYGMVVPAFIKAALKNDPLYVYGDGNQSRCFLNVLDAITAIVGLMENSTYGEVYNIGSSEEITINDLAKKVISITKSKSEIKYLSYEEAYGEGFEDMNRRVPDTTRIEKKIGFNPIYSLDQTITQMIENL